MLDTGTDGGGEAVFFKLENKSKYLLIVTIYLSNTHIKLLYESSTKLKVTEYDINNNIKNFLIYEKNIPNKYQKIYTLITKNYTLNEISIEHLKL